MKRKGRREIVMERMGRKQRGRRSLGSERELEGRRRTWEGGQQGVGSEGGEKRNGRDERYIVRGGEE